jgi:hypothetical protein
VQFGRSLRVREGVRPGTKAGGFRRPYARVEAVLTPELLAADRRATLTRRQILRRAARA